MATFKQEKTLGSPEETRIIQDALGKQVIVFDPQNAVTNFKKLARDPTWGAHLAVVYHTVIIRPRNRMRAQGQPKQLKQDSFFHYIAATLPYMRAVKEIILLDPNVDQSAATARDLLEGNTDMQLETLWCDLEALLAKCWASLCSGRTLIKLQDFRGFCDPHQPPPERIAPPISPELKYFETSAHFAMRLPISWHITHLSIHVQWGELPLILKKISTLPGLSDQLHALRLNCYTRKEGAEQPAGSTATTPKRRISPLAVQWPRIVCRNLTAGVLNYLEIKEVTPVSPVTIHGRGTNVHTLKSSTTVRADLCFRTALA